MKLRHSIAALLCLYSVLTGAPAANDEALLRHLRYLASDELKGRGNTSPEIRQAARYIAEQFQLCGLEPGGNNASYLQEFPLTAGYHLKDSSRAFFRSGGETMPLQAGTDYAALTYGRANRVSGPVLFAGFGITAADWKYDDYQGLDVKDKIVLILDGEPQPKAGTSPFRSAQLTPFGSRMHKIMNAKHRGAAAVLIVASSAESIRQRPRSESPNIEDIGIHTLLINPEWLEKLLAVSGRSREEVFRSLHAHVTPYSFSMESVQAEIELEVSEVRQNVENVVGFLPGESAEYVILGAHYDHLGLGDQSSLEPSQVGSVHNGADDNASGTAGILQLACELSPRPRKLGVLFIAFAGEEVGLLGSRHYADNPKYPLNKAVAMLNLDMIGRSSGDLTIGGVGTAEAFKPLLDRLQRNSPLRFRYSDSVRGSSDHQSFTEKGIPSLFFFSGLHSDYHKPSDDWEKIDLVRTGQILDVVRQTISQLETEEQGLKFVAVKEPHGHAGSAGGGSGYGPLFGSVPDMAWDSGGVRFADVRSGTPAAQAGLKGGDILVEFDGKKIDNLYDFTYALRSRKPGDLIPVKILRDEQTLKVEVTLGQR